MAAPNAVWGGILTQAQAAPDTLRQPDVIKSLQNVVQVRAAGAPSQGLPAA